MRRHIVLAWLLIGCPLAAFANEGSVLEIEVRGMICAFCVEGLRSKLSELPGVKHVQVSLKEHRTRIQIDEGHELDLDALKKAIIDAGFTPGDVHRGA